MLATPGPPSACIAIGASPAEARLAVLDRLAPQDRWRLLSAAEKKPCGAGACTRYLRRFPNCHRTVGLRSRRAPRVRSLRKALQSLEEHEMISPKARFVS